MLRHLGTADDLSLLAVKRAMKRKIRQSHNVEPLVVHEYLYLYMNCVVLDVPVNKDVFTKLVVLLNKNHISVITDEINRMRVDIIDAIDRLRYF